MISVVLPAYNSERFIGEAIESILDQTFTEFELIIVDDGSTDGTVNIADHYAKQDPRVQIIRSDHGGISKALNIGIEHAKYDWIAVMHADDIALPQRLEKQINAAETKPRVVTWGAYAYHISERGKILSLSKVGPVNEEEFSILRRNGEVVLVIHPTAFMRKSIVIKAGGYNSQFDGSEELELFQRIAEFGPVLAIPEPLLLYRIHTSSVTMQRFFNMRVFTRYVRARQHARAKGERLPDWDKFIREYESAPLLGRLRRKIDDLSQYYYRRFAVAVSSGEYLKAILFFSSSAALNPAYAVPRVWHQRFGRMAKEYLKALKSYNRQR